MKSRIAEISAKAQRAACVVGLEKANAQLHVELDASRSKLSEVEHRERARASEYEDLKKDFEDMRAAYDAMVKEKAEVEEIEHTKLQWFQDSLREKLPELWHDTEASVATLGGRSAEFPTNASLSNFLDWF
jgi:chromosome segregation ATPase